MIIFASILSIPLVIFAITMIVASTRKTKNSNNDLLIPPLASPPRRSEKPVNDYIPEPTPVPTTMPWQTPEPSTLPPDPSWQPDPWFPPGCIGNGSYGCSNTSDCCANTEQGGDHMCLSTGFCGECIDDNIGCTNSKDCCDNKKCILGFCSHCIEEGGEGDGFCTADSQCCDGDDGSKAYCIWGSCKTGCQKKYQACAKSEQCCNHNGEDEDKEKLSCFMGYCDHCTDTEMPCTNDSQCCGGKDPDDPYSGMCIGISAAGQLIGGLCTNKCRKNMEACEKTSNCCDHNLTNMAAQACWDTNLGYMYCDDCSKEGNYCSDDSQCCKETGDKGLPPGHDRTCVQYLEAGTLNAGVCSLGNHKSPCCGNEDCGSKQQDDGTYTELICGGKGVTQPLCFGMDGAEAGVLGECGDCRGKGEDCLWDSVCCKNPMNNRVCAWKAWDDIAMSGALGKELVCSQGQIGDACAGLEDCDNTNTTFDDRKICGLRGFHGSDSGQCMYCIKDQRYGCLDNEDCCQDKDNPDDKYVCNNFGGLFWSQDSYCGKCSKKNEPAATSQNCCNDAKYWVYGYCHDGGPGSPCSTSSDCQNGYTYTEYNADGSSRQVTKNLKCLGFNLNPLGDGTMFGTCSAGQEGDSCGDTNFDADNKDCNEYGKNGPLMCYSVNNTCQNRQGNGKACNTGDECNNGCKIQDAFSDTYNIFDSLVTGGGDKLAIGKCYSMSDNDSYCYFDRDCNSQAFAEASDGGCTMSGNNYGNCSWSTTGGKKCMAGFYCSTGNNGDWCWDNNDCNKKRDQYCIGISSSGPTPSCGKKIDNGNLCFASKDCKSGHCVDAECQSGNEGSKCYHDSDCGTYDAGGYQQNYQCAWAHNAVYGRCAKRDCGDLGNNCGKCCNDMNCTWNCCGHNYCA